MTVPALRRFSLSCSYYLLSDKTSRATSTIIFVRSSLLYTLSISIPMRLSIRASFSSACESWVFLWPISPFRFPQSKMFQVSSVQNMPIFFGRKGAPS